MFFPRMPLACAMRVKFKQVSDATKSHQRVTFQRQYTNPVDSGGRGL